MGPKKVKGAIDENYWRTQIEEYRLDEENWKVKVILFEAAGSDQDRIYLNKFEVFAAEERRFVVKNICKTETIFMINQLGGEKKVKDDNFRVFEEGQNYLKLKQDVPSDILALIIKHLIIKMKEEYLFIKRQRLEVKEGIRRESATMVDKVEVKGTVNVLTPVLEPPPPQKKGKKEIPETVEVAEQNEGKKYNTQLRVRGEEWRDKVYVDDFPTDGPNLYVAVSGFLDHLLPGHLLKIGVPLTAIVQIRIDVAETKVPSSLFRPTKRGQSQTEILTEKSLKFWEDLQQLRIQKDSADSLKNTAFVVFSPPYWDAEALSGNPDKIYDELCFLMYDIQDLTRQHFHYLDNMDIISIPDEIGDICNDRQYHQLINDLPIECVTVYSVLDAMLQIICKGPTVDEKSSRSSLSTAVTINQPPVTDDKIDKAATLVTQVFNRLCSTEQNKKSYRVTQGEEYENYVDPIIINYGDLAKYTTFQLGNINLHNIIWSSLFGSPLHKLWCNKKRPDEEIEAKLKFHINTLLSCFERNDVEDSELHRLIHILAFRKMFNNRSSLKKNHLQSNTICDFKKTYLKRSILAEPLPKCSSLLRSCSSMSHSFPSMTQSENVSDVSSYDSECEILRTKFLFDCPDISELVSAAEVANEKPSNHLIDEYEYFEDFDGICAFQMMSDAFNKFNCVDYKYCEVTDCFLLMFFNSHDKNGIAREEWRCHLPTPLCLQDFFDFVLEEHYDWIQAEEKIYDENIVLKSQSICKNLIDPLALQSCVGDTEVKIDLLIEGSLKYQEIAQIEEQSSESTEFKVDSSKKTTLSPSSTEGKSSKKTKSPALSTPKNLKQSFTGNLGSKTSTLVPKKPFLGYNLSDRRVEVFGRDAVYYSKDGTRVTSLYTLIIPMNVEYIVLNILPGNSYNEFWFHKVLGEDVSSEVFDICESFRVTTKDQAIINIKKQNYYIPIPIMNIPSSIGNKRKDSAQKSPSIKLSSVIQQPFETQSFHSFFITWPNGLITESVYCDNSPVISHIKMYYIDPLIHLNEEMRCISLNGEVIIFKKSGHIEVLKAEGSYIKILKCEKRIVYSNLAEDLKSDTSSEKSKKSKTKDKLGKEKKTSKSSSKSSKNGMSDDDKISEEKLPIYELIIEEFESIDTNGLHQRWTYDNSIDLEKILIRTATDYCLGEVFSRRMDGTNILLNKDGVQIVTFSDGTRIITNYFEDDEEIFPEWTEEEKEYFDMLNSDSIESRTIKSKGSMSQKSYIGDTHMCNYSAASSFSRKLDEEYCNTERTDGFVSVNIVYTIEHRHFTTVTVHKNNGKIIVDSPNKTSLTVDTNNHYDITLDAVTTVKFNGENVTINYEACPDCQSNTVCEVKIKNNDISSVAKIQQNWMKMKDSFLKKIVVNGEGEINFIEDSRSTDIFQSEDTVIPEERIDNDEEKETDGKSESSVVSHGKCREMYTAKTMKFFVLKRELTCSELIHRALVEQCIQSCRWQPWCSINQYDTFGDYRSLLSLLIPVNLTESEKWLMESRFADKPKYLTYKDLKNDLGKGFYHWMRPYKRFEAKPIKPNNILPPRLPRAFILRTLEQQWKEIERETLKGAKELINAILRYRHVMESDSETLLNIPIVDSRLEEERRTDEIIQALAHRIYENLKTRLEDDVLSRAKATLTTKPRSFSEEISIEGEIEDEGSDDLKALEGENEALVKELEAVEPCSDNLARYWRRRAEEYKEEQFYQYLLREGSVPPYFQNILGGAIWWEMNNVAGEAATKSERRKTKCTCAPEEGTSIEEDMHSINPFM